MFIIVPKPETISAEALSYRVEWLRRQRPGEWEKFLEKFGRSEYEETHLRWSYCPYYIFFFTWGSSLRIESRFSFWSSGLKHICFDTKEGKTMFHKFPEEFFDKRVEKNFKKFSKNYDKISLTKTPLTFAPQELFYNEKKKAFIEKYSRKDLKKYLLKGLKEDLDKYLEDDSIDPFNKALKKNIMLQMDEYLEIYLDYFYTKWLDDLIRDIKEKK